MSFSVNVNVEWFLQRRTSQAASTVNSVSTDATLDPGIEVTVYPHWYSHASIAWTVPSTWGSCVFRVYTQDGPAITELTTTPIAGPTFLDTTLRETSKFHNISYIVEAILTTQGNALKRSIPTTWEYKRRDWVELRYNEIQRREYLLLSKFVGVKSYIFRKRIYGARCTRCWNSDSEMVVDDHCPVCYGTSFLGGYFDPLPSFIQYDSTPNDRRKGYQGNIEPNQIGAWTISIPEISPDDVLIRTGDWAAYRVSRVTPTELQTKTVRQILTLTQFSRSDIENTLANRIESYLGSSYLEVIPSGTPKVETYVGVQERLPKTFLQTNSGNPQWLQDVNEETLPIKYNI